METRRWKQRRVFCFVAGQDHCNSLPSRFTSPARLGANIMHSLCLATGLAIASVAAAPAALAQGFMPVSEVVKILPRVWSPRRQRPSWKNCARGLRCSSAFPGTRQGRGSTKRSISGRRLRASRKRVSSTEAESGWHCRIETVARAPPRFSMTAKRGWMTRACRSSGIWDVRQGHLLPASGRLACWIRYSANSSLPESRPRRMRTTDRGAAMPQASKKPAPIARGGLCDVCQWLTIRCRSA